MNKNKESVTQNKTNGLTRKGSIKNKKPPEVRQTLTSKFRLLKANPTLICELEKKVVGDTNDKKESLPVVKPLKTLVKAFDGNCHVDLKTNPKPIVQTPVVTTNNSNTNKTKPTKNFLSLNKLKIESYSKAKSNFNPASATKKDFKSGKLLSSTIIENKQENGKKIIKNTKPGINYSQQNKNNCNSKSLTDNKTLKPVRRSLSAQHFDRKKGNLSNSLNSCYARPLRTQSLEEIKCVTSTNTKQNIFSPINEELSSKNGSSSNQSMFKTPMTNCDRRNTFHTANNTSIVNHRKSMALLTPTANEMSKRLNEWLKHKGKSSKDYHHLKCFGILEEKDDENKENDSTKSVDNDSYEDLKIIPEKVEDDVVQVVPNNKLEEVAKEALVDLHKLILEGYSNEQCEAWLKLIKQKYKELEEEPQYWECRAALEQSRGNLNLAVECYKTAIVQGAEVNAVDESLDQLLQKFSLLNINKDTDHDKNQDRARIVQAARNIFKSSIIQFAVQERTLKKRNKEGVTFEKKLVATPVRRSTRLSRSAYTSTPGIKIYSSLKEVESPIRNTLDFQYNNALFD